MADNHTIKLPVNFNMAWCKHRHAGALHVYLNCHIRLVNKEEENTSCAVSNKSVYCKEDYVYVTGPARINHVSANYTELYFH